MGRHIPLTPREALILAARMEREKWEREGAPCFDPADAADEHGHLSLDAANERARDRRAFLDQLQGR